MPWPNKIAQGGRGSNRGLVPRPKSDMKRDFMQKAALVLLQEFPMMDLQLIAESAEILYDKVEERVKK